MYAIYIIYILLSISIFIEDDVEVVYINIYLHCIWNIATIQLYVCMYIQYTLLLKGLGSVRFFILFKEVSSAHQHCCYLINNTEKKRIVKYYCNTFKHAIFGGILWLIKSEKEQHFFFKKCCATICNAIQKFGVSTFFYFFFLKKLILYLGGMC